MTPRSQTTPTDAAHAGAAAAAAPGGTAGTAAKAQSGAAGTEAAGGRKGARVVSPRRRPLKSSLFPTEQPPGGQSPAQRPRWRLLLHPAWDLAPTSCCLTAMTTGGKPPLVCSDSNHRPSMWPVTFHGLRSAIAPQDHPANLTPHSEYPVCQSFGWWLTRCVLVSAGLWTSRLRPVLWFRRPPPESPGRQTPQPSWTPGSSMARPHSHVTPSSCSPRPARSWQPTTTQTAGRVRGTQTSRQASRPTSSCQGRPRGAAVQPKGLRPSPLQVSLSSIAMQGSMSPTAVEQWARHRAWLARTVSGGLPSSARVEAGSMQAEVAVYQCRPDETLLKEGRVS